MDGFMFKGLKKPMKVEKVWIGNNWGYIQKEEKPTWKTIKDETVQFSQTELKLLKKLINNPRVMSIIADYPRAIVKDGLFDQAHKICKLYGISLEQLVGRKRDRYLAKARRDFCHLTKNHTKHSVGRFLHRDHTIVIYYLKKPPHNLDKISE
tara:strand:- start:62 stop:517 length:456 start_codon:yes stop_codon:yes gene_type:complete